MSLAVFSLVASAALAPDVVYLNGKIVTVDPDRIRAIPIEATIVGGREIYRRDRSATSGVDVAHRR